MEHLWTPWRMAYIRGEKTPIEGCVLCNKIDGDDAEERISGEIAQLIDEDALSFFLITSTPDGGVTVVLEPGATIRVFEGDGDQMPGEFVDIVEGRAAEAYGELGVDGFFHATAVLVDTSE